MSDSVSQNMRLLAKAELGAVERRRCPTILIRAFPSAMRSIGMGGGPASCQRLVISSYMLLGARGGGSMTEAAMSGAAVQRVTLEDLAQGVRLTGLTASETAEVVATEWHGKDAVTVVFRSEDGGIHQQVLLRDQ